LLIEETNNTKLDIWELTDFVAERIESKKELANFFFLWIGKNINYDSQTLKQIEQGIISLKEFFDSQDEYYVYENRKAVCLGYVDLNKDQNFRHGWNAVKLNNE